MSIKIATFGCWNNRYNNSSLDYPRPMDCVINSVQNHNTREHYNELIILGDNYYPVKEIGKDKLKHTYYDRDSHLLGLTQLNKININTKSLILGNHDIEDCTNCEHKSSSSHTPCIIREIEEKFCRYNHIDLYSPIHGKELSIGDRRYMIIYIDTNIYGKDNNCRRIDSDEYHHELTLLLNNPTISHFIICGHEPLISYKEKENKIKSSNLDSLLDKIETEIHRRTYKPAITYVCADVHMYQHSYIHFNNSNIIIEQIVCGTGGADLDSLNSYIVNKPINIKIDDSNKCTFSILRNESKYGFVELELTNTGLRHGFISLDNNSGCIIYDPQDYIKEAKSIEAMQEEMKKELEISHIPLTDSAERKNDSTERKEDKYYTKYIKYKLKYINLKKDSNI